MCNKSVHLSIDSTWLKPSRKPLLITGPCSAENESQVLKTAQEIAQSPELASQIAFFRAGIWKPRTRPGDFEGAGEEALLWLKRVKEETGFKIMTEVGSGAHVKACLNVGLDAVWIGARSTVSPFLMDELAEALRGTDIPIFVKNPVSPDLELWIGALERLNRAGIRKLIGVHRGFSTMNSAPLRGLPLWEIPRKLKTLVPDLPIICDPSHIAGKVEQIASIVRMASDSKIFDGWMIETHCNPRQALSDVEQQLTPVELARLLAG